MNIVTTLARRPSWENDVLYILYCTCEALERLL